MQPFEREDAIRQSIHSRYKHPRTHLSSNFNLYNRSNTNDTDFSHLSRIKLNKNKKYMLEEQRNTQIDRSNRILYEKLAKCANRNPQVENKRPKKRKNKSRINTLPHSPRQNSGSPQTKYRFRSNTLLKNQQKKQIKDKHHNQQQVKTLFMGHSFIDGVQFKIKLLINNSIYYLVAENQHSRIFLQMPQEQYRELHYGQLEENPCNIFQYLEIEKGRVQFRVKKQQKLPKGISKTKKMKQKNKRKHKTQQKLKTKQNVQIQQIRNQIRIKQKYEQNSEDEYEQDIKSIIIKKRRMTADHNDNNLKLPKISKI